MIPTKQYIEQKFKEFNSLMFGGKLPAIPVEMSDAKTFLGKFVYRTRKGRDGKTEFYNCRLRINTRVDLPEREVEDTLIHEMIHYYIAYNQLEDSSSHGPLFQQIMNAINAKFGRSISVTFKGTKEQNEQFQDKKRHYHVVAVVRLRDGRTGVKVLPRILQRILMYYNAVSAAKEVLSVQLYMSDNVFFNRFPNSSALKAHFIDEEEVLENLKGAEELPCDGKSIRRTK